MPRTLGLIKLRLELLEPGAAIETSGLSTEIDEGDPALSPIADGNYDVLVVLPEEPDAKLLTPTTVAGALRKHVDESFDTDFASALLGSPSPAASADVELVTSAIAVLDVRCVATPSTDTRLVTTIDPRRMAASLGGLRPSAFAAAGTAWDVYLFWRDPEAATWNSVIDTLSAWRPLLGRGKTIGRGRAHVQMLATGILDLATPEGLTTYLTSHGPALFDAAATNEQPVANEINADRIFKATCTLRQALHIGDGAFEGTRPGRARLYRSAGIPTVPGASLKGLFRHRFAYILRSVAFAPEPCDDGSCSRCLLCDLFGSSGRRRTEAGTEQAPHGALRFLDARLTGIDGTAPRIADRYHSPIDRFTGGIANQTIPPPEGDAWSPWIRRGLLHAEETVESGTFTIVAEQLRALSDRDLMLTRVLCRLVLADLHDGLITVGGRGTRGFGLVSVTDGDSLMSLSVARSILRNHVDGTSKL